MPPKLSKSDYEKALSAEWGFPVFLNDKEYERLSVSKPNPVRPAKPYEDPFAYLDDEKKRKASPDAWTTKKGATYNSENKRDTIPGATYNAMNGRTKADGPRYSGFEGEAPKKPGMMAGSAPLAGVPSSVALNVPAHVASPTIGKIAPPSDGTSPKPKMEYQPYVWELGGDTSGIEDLGSDTRPNDYASIEEDRQRAALAAVPEQLASLPQTYKQAYVAPKPVMPQWQSDEDEVNQMNAKYAALGGGK